MFYSNVNADFAAYEPKVAAGLTKRQMICFVLAALFGIPVYYMTKDMIGTDLAGIVMVLVMMPLFLLAMYKKDGQKLESVLKHYVKEQYFSNKVRVVSTNPVIYGAMQTSAYAKEVKGNKKGILKPKGKKGKKQAVHPDDKLSTEMLRDYAAAMHKAQRSGKRPPRTSAESLPFLRMDEKGLCYLGKGKYSIMMKLSDMNYVQLDDREQKDIWSLWCMFLNTLDYDAKFQLCFHNHKADIDSLAKQLEIGAKEEHECHRQLINELNENTRKNLKKGNKGLSKEMYLLVTFSVPGYKVRTKAKEYAERIKNDLYDKLGVSTELLNGYERLSVLFHMLNPDPKEKMFFNWDISKNGGISEKEQIVNHAFIFGKKSDRFEIGAKHGSVSYLRLDATQISDRLLSKFLDMDSELILSIHIEPINREKAARDVRRLVSDLQKMVIDEQKAASNRGYSMSNISAPLKANLEAAERTLEGITQNDEKMFMAVITMVQIADSVAKLERDYNMARAIANEESCELIRLEHQQEDGYFSSLPLGINKIETRRQLTTTSLGLLLPFKILELVQFGDALSFGVNKITGNVIFADIKELANPNTLVLGTPGRGKSFHVKMMIMQIFFKLNDDIIINDPEGEYGVLVKLLGGEIIKLSQSGKAYLNPLDIHPDCDWSSDPISDKIQLVMSMFEQILGSKNGDPVDKSIIDRCMQKLYQKFKESKDVNDLPILEDLYEELKKQPGERAKYLKEALEVYVHGSLNYFNHRTNVNTDNRIICFDIKELGEQLKPLAMLIVQETVWGKVSANRIAKKYTWYIADEFHLLLKEPQTALYSKEIYKRFRKWGGIPLAITQNVTDLLDSTQAQSIFFNSDCYILLGQASGDADRLAEALKLSQEQYKCIMTRNKGEGLLIYGETILPFVNRIEENTQVYKMITTKVTEMEE